MKHFSDRSRLIIAMVSVATLFMVGHYWVHAERHNFERQVHVGQTADEVRSLVGDPFEELVPGDQLKKWGNVPERIVTEPTWVYFVIPESQHRFVITFRDNQVADVSYAGN